MPHGNPRFSKQFRRSWRGTPFATLAAMSPIAHALHLRFEEVCRAELQRLRRKTASLSPEERAEVDAISVAVTQAIADRVEAALDAHQEGPLADIVARLFAVPPLSSQSAAVPADGGRS